MCMFALKGYAISHKLFHSISLNFQRRLSKNVFRVEYFNILCNLNVNTFVLAASDSEAVWGKSRMMLLSESNLTE